MLILGIDPGFAITGYGIIKYEANRFSIVEYGAILTEANTPLENRLLKIDRELTGLLDKYHPEAVAVEELFFNKNIKTAINVAHGRGAIILACARGGIPVSEYTPLQVKQSVVGYGRADKSQVQKMVKTILNLPEIPKPDDVADALAVAICHAHSYMTGSVLEQLMHGK